MTIKGVVVVILIALYVVGILEFWFAPLRNDLDDEVTDYERYDR